MGERCVISRNLTVGGSPNFLFKFVIENEVVHVATGVILCYGRTMTNIVFPCTHCSPES